MRLVCFWPCRLLLCLMAGWISCSLAGGAGHATAADLDEYTVTYHGQEGPGKGKRVVFVTGDDEYRSEESMPHLARILAKHHGFDCTVLFATDPATGAITPAYQENIPGTELLAKADLMVLFVRFRDLPPEQLQPILDYVNSGKPIIALRTSTHPFDFRKYKTDETAKLSWNCEQPGSEGGFGRQVLGETWVSHYGAHQVESTRGIPAPGQDGHPILRGVQGIWGPSDVYGINKLTGDSQAIVNGQVLVGMNETDAPKAGMELTPIAWTKTHQGTSGKAARVFTTTMGHAGDLANEGVRRMLVNAAYWGQGMEEQIDPKRSVAFVGEYAPTPIGFGKAKAGVKARDWRLPE